ncbi:MAG: nucleoside deaminase [Gammaproteobacteria bacterium]|nr:nucleoside deaminase [Gammaproteobacteria bacterium]
MITDTDLAHLRRCVALAEEALLAGDQPFGSRLVAGDGRVLKEARNRAVTVDRTRHPEFELARWAGEHLSADERAAATVYTSGEHCPMCAAAHAFVGLGRIVYASSTRQLTEWLAEFGPTGSRVRSMAIGEVAPGLVVDGPVPELAESVRELHRHFHAR